MNTSKKNWMNFTHSSLLYQTITKNVLGYFQVNSEILETRISSSSKFVPQKNSSSIFKFEPEKVSEVQVFLYQVISSLLPSLPTSYKIKRCITSFIAQLSISLEKLENIYHVVVLQLSSHDF